jgi:hypothetical protein
MADNQVHLEYTRVKNELKKMEVAIDEKRGGDVVLSWALHFERKNDSNYRIESEFNGVKAYMEVRDGTLASYNNFHQLMALMNRLDAILLAAK